MGHSYVPRNPRGQQRDKKLREIARALIDKSVTGDIQAIKEIRDTLDGRPAQVLEHSGDSGRSLMKIVHEIVHVTETQEMIDSEIDSQSRGVDYREIKVINGPINGHEGNDSGNGNGSGQDR